MSHELIYTSAPRGLKPGSRGFCTVASTPGMTQPLADRLESLSGYRHAFAAHDSQAALNPVNYSHLIITLAGRKYHVLSRIADAGLDYTQRSNKFAHHVVLEPNELTPAGPARLMQEPGFFETAFTGEPRLLTAGRRAAPGDSPVGICRQWQQTTGDAGWAGVLAETILALPQKTVYLLFAPGQDLLPLIAEALTLLPPERRWQATYSTYFTKLPPGLECQWRFLLSGSDEAKAAARLPHALVINLCQPLPPAQGGALIEAARTGRLPAIEHPATRRAAAPPPLLPVADSSEVEAGQLANRTDYELLPLASRRFDDAGIDLAGLPHRRRKQKTLIGAAACGLIAVVFTAAVAKVMIDKVRPGVAADDRRAITQSSPLPGSVQNPPNRSGAPETSTADNASGPKAKSLTARPAQRNQDERPSAEDQNDPKGDGAAKPAQEQATAGRKTTGAALSASKPGVPTPQKADHEVSSKTGEPNPQDEPLKEPEGGAPTPEQPAQPPSPFVDIDSKGRRLPIPVSDANAAALAILPVADPQALELRLMDWDKFIGGGLAIDLAPQNSSQVAGRVWQIIKRSNNSNAIGGDRDVAKFMFHEGRLLFCWESPAYSTSESWLRNCALSLKYKGEERLCDLKKPAIADAIVLDFKSPVAEIELSNYLEPYSSQLAELLRLELDFPKEALQKPMQRETITPQKTARLSVSWGEDRVDVVCALAYTPKKGALKLAYFVTVPQWDKDKRQVVRTEKPFSKKLLNDWRDDAMKEIQQIQSRLGKQRPQSSLGKKGNSSNPPVGVGVESRNDELRREEAEKMLEALKEWRSECERRLAALERFAATVRFRIYYQVGERQIVIAQTPETGQSEAN